MANVLDAVKEQAKYQAQRDLLIDYIGEHYDMLVGDDNVLDDYVSHETSADGETITVRLKVRRKSGPGEPKNFALTKQRVIKRSDIVEYHKSRGRELNHRTDLPPTKPVAVHQVSWADQRQTILQPGTPTTSGTYLASIMRKVSIVGGQTPTGLYPLMRVDMLKCSCVNTNTGPTLCEHLKFVYVTGWERENLIDDGTVVKCIVLPIGMGYTSITVLVDHILTDDRDKTGMVTIRDYPHHNTEAGRTSDPLLKIAEEVSAYPEESAKIVLHPGEGVIKAIRYIEDMIKSTEAYQILSLLAADDKDMRGKASMVCSRRHERPVDRALLAQFQAGIRLGNPNRDNWLVACAFTSKAYGLCLPCHEATSASNNVPRV